MGRTIVGAWRATRRWRTAWLATLLVFAPLLGAPPSDAANHADEGAKGAPPLVVTERGGGPRAAGELRAEIAWEPGKARQATVRFNWRTAAKRGKKQRLQVSSRPDGFEWGDYWLSEPIPASHGTLEWPHVPAGTHFWKVLTLQPEGWIESETGSIEVVPETSAEPVSMAGPAPVPIGMLDAACAPVFDDINPNSADIDANDPDGASSGRCNGLATVAGDNQTYYVATEWGGIAKSTDGGATWNRLTGHQPVACWDVEVDPGNTQIVYATSFYDGRQTPISGIQVSRDAGQTWTHPPTSVPNAVADEGGPNDNTPQAGYSCSAGRRTEPAAFGVAIMPGASQQVFVGTNCGLAISNDSGNTWTIVDPTPATPASNVWDVVVQAGGPSGQGIIDVVGDTGHHRSTDGGTTWSANNLPAAATGRSSIAVSPDETYVLLVAGANATLYESDNAGAAWANLGRTDPVRGGGRIPFVATNQRTTGFDLWTGGVSLYRVACTTPNPAAPGGAARCPAGANPLPAGWFGGFTRGGLGAATGAHDDVGDIVFDSATATDAVPRLMTSDGGVYRATTTSAGPTGTGNLVWEQPTRTPHALWLYGMQGTDQPGDTTEDLHFGCQDNGTFANLSIGAADPAPAWHVRDCCDTFDVAADDDRVLFTNGSFGNGRQFPLFLGTRGLAGFASTQINTYPAGGLSPAFRFAESVDTWGDNRFAVVMDDCVDTYPTDGRDNDNDGMVDNAGETNGCPGGVAGSDGGLFITTDITAAPIVWTELGAVEPFNSTQLVQVRAALDGMGAPTFFVSVGGGNGLTADQLWRFVGTNPAGAWTRIDSNIPGATGVNVWAVDRANPNRLYAAAVTGAGPAMFFSTDGGGTWTPDADLDALMTGNGAFPYQNQSGPTEFTSFGGYSQPVLIAFDPEDPNLIVAAGRDSGVFLSRNGGARWGLLTDPLMSSVTGIPHLPRPWFAHFDHEPVASDRLRLTLGTQGFGVWRITLPISVPVATIPGPVDFPPTCLGSTGTQTLNVCNTGSGCNNLIVNTITSSDPQFVVTEPSSGFPVEISPDFCFPFQVRFSPTATGAQAGTLSVSTNDPVTPVVDVAASGAGTQPRVALTGSTEFGDVCAGPRAEKTLSICNVGGCDLQVLSVAFDPSCLDFQLVNSPFPNAVSHDFCLDQVIRFTPTSAGPKSCTLVITTNDPLTPMVSRTVTGNTPAPVIDVPPDLSFPPTVIQSRGPCVSSLPFPVSNTGTCPLEITNFSITTAPAEYGLTGLPSFPIRLAPGHVAGEGDLRVTFAPTELDRDRLGAVSVTYTADPITGTPATVTRTTCGEGVHTGARVLVRSGGVPIDVVEKLQLHRLTGNKNKNILDSVDVVGPLSLQSVTPAAPCPAFQYHREYGAVSNPVQLAPGSYRVTATAIVAGRRRKKTVGFDVSTCDFNPTVVVDLP